jgi:ABC-type sugar transport system ATPase subunit
MVRVDLLGVRLPRTPAAARALTELAPRLTFERGMCNVVVGPTGGGKSALMAVLAGLRQPLAGQVLFDDCDVTAQPPRARNVAYAAPAPVVYASLSVRDNLALPLQRRAWSAADIAARVGEVSAALDLAALAAERAGALPPIVQQRVALGRAFVRQDAAAIVLDDPFHAVPLHQRGALHGALLELAATVRATVVLATREVDEALAIADRMVYLAQGRAVQVGPPSAVRARPRTTEVARVLGGMAFNVLPCEVRGGTLMVGSTRIERPSVALEAWRGRRIELGVYADELEILPTTNHRAATPAALLAQLAGVERAGAQCWAKLRVDQLTLRAACAPQPGLVSGYRYHVALPRTPRVYVDGELTDG